MKLFWKLFCSMVLITALACSAGGYALIDAQFRSSLDREVSALYEENDLLRFALAQELAFHPLYSREALALLPARLSALRDGQLTGTVHAEPLSGDSNFPFKPPELPGRIRLLCQYRTFPDRVVLMEQSLERDSEDWRNAAGMANAELYALSGAGVLPFQIVEPYLDYSVTRLYLRDPEDLSSAGFLLMCANAKETGFYVDLVLDIETGKALAVDLSTKKDYLFDAPALELGKAVLDRLGLEYVPGEDHNAAASFRLPECGSEFRILNESGRWLNFSFQLDWSAVDAETAEMYGWSVSAVDANPIRKW